MERVNKILKHIKFKEYVEKIEVFEKDRKFCKHDMGHFLDVCRLSRILYLQECLDYSKARDCRYKSISDEMFYAAGLLHDIGRWQEYEIGIRHEVSSANLSQDILKDCDFSEEESAEIIMAIRNHRNKDIKDDISLSGFLYRADKMSRTCFACKAESICNWELCKKNMEILI